jgi:hypothetical protein
MFAGHAPAFLPSQLLGDLGVVLLIAAVDILKRSTELIAHTKAVQRTRMLLANRAKYAQEAQASRSLRLLPTSQAFRFVRCYPLEAKNRPFCWATR